MHGGKRINAGRKPSPFKYKNITFRVREEWSETIKTLVRNKIKELKT